MFRTAEKRAFTLIELLVVVAIIALLISILLPSLAAAREQGKRATCLSNMGSIAKGSASYSTEDKREHAVPIHQNMVSTRLPNGFASGEWALKTALPYSYGGRTAQVPFPGQGDIMTKEHLRWAARTKPLNRYLYGSSGMGSSDSRNMPLYKCPSDTGYIHHPLVRDAPDQGRDVAGIPCYDFLGNSYRINVAGVYWPSLNSFTIAPWGHRAGTLVNTSRLTNYMEPLFYTMTFATVDGGTMPPTLLITGWHKAVMISNVAYADGSARSTKVQGLQSWDADTLQKMNYYNPTPDGARTFLRRGESWQMDCYPTPGAFMPKYSDQGVPASPKPSGTGWPFSNYQDNTGDLIP